MNWRKRPLFGPALFFVSALKPKQKQFSDSAKAGANGGSLARLLTIVCWYIVRRFTLKILSKFVLFFFPPPILSVGSKIPVASLIIVIFQRLILMPSCFGPDAQTVTVFFSHRLSAQRIVPRAPMEDGARWPVYSRRLHRGGSHSDLWRQGNTASSIQVRALDGARRA